MPELRHNLITGDWVILATERARRPEEFARPRQRKPVPPFLAACPFCPGNEGQTPGETFHLDDPGDGWAVRSIPNKYSALAPQDAAVRREDGIRQSLGGVGFHEVVIETPRHDITIPDLPIEHVEAVLRAFRSRFLAFYADPRIKHVIIFKNHGEAAGTSMEHPHSQIVGTPVIPRLIRIRVEEALRYYGDQGECLYCRTIREEMGGRSRVVSENERFVAFLPYAALSPFHLWIFPKRHGACFGTVPEEEMADLAAILKDTLLRVSVGLDDPDFNIVFRSLSPAEGSVKYFHWYLSLVPRVTRTAGFELGTGMFINPAFPEKSAEFLRGVAVEKFL
jgi:UDPglucose--hexose-1-phosphate uridylyltransferase